MTVFCVWICLFVWTAVAAQSSLRETLTVLYPKIGGTESLNCNCPDHTCQEAFWYRYLEKNDTLQFLLYYNSAGTGKHGELANHTKQRIKGSMSAGSKASYNLRITGLQEDEAGIYSCMFKTKHVIPVGYYIRPGVNPPTLQPPTVKPKNKSKQSCKFCRAYTPEGCERSVLWSGIGALLLLAVALAGTLYYFSRLPKKCRHQFAKTNQYR